MTQKRSENSKDISWKNKQLKFYFEFKLKNVYLTSVLEICIFANLLLIPIVNLFLSEFSVMLFISIVIWRRSGSSGWLILRLIWEAGGSNRVKMTWHSFYFWKPRTNIRVLLEGEMDKGWGWESDLLPWNYESENGSEVMRF